MRFGEILASFRKSECQEYPTDHTSELGRKRGFRVVQMHWKDRWENVDLLGKTGRGRYSTHNIKKGFSMKRREFIALAAGTLAAPVFIKNASAASKELRLLTWEGYADEQWVKAFEEKTGSTVSVSYTGSVDEIFAKMTASDGADFDVVAIETSSYKRLTQEALIQPLDLAKLPSASNLMPAFKSVAAIIFDGKTYAAPFAWGSIPLIYNADTFKAAPDSWEILWDPRYKGKIIVMDDANNAIVTAALTLGIKDPFNLTEADFAAIKTKLLAQKANVASYYAGFDDGVSIFAQGGIDLMMSMGEPQAPMLTKQGVNVGLTVPKEGAIGWIDCWTISKGARDVDLAHAWIDAMLEKDVGTYISEKTGYGNTTDAAANENIGLTYSEKLVFLQAPEDFARRIEVWNEIKATPVQQ
ncbi:extracellular solute-binding protein [Rhizobium leguminosarum bv. viciae]|uniref:Extracellular solute-binding protein n=3 Tax=Rhizobium/Agrobacterium group TaxID=227290 RepID=A0A8I2GV81_RHILV|nr:MULTISPECIES: ABC transporter substrate-binding protein [Rhizobium]MBY3171509.1 ABC transporter substrate-binding protein [Rhizobium laguerreae]MBY3185498.1 ABC transporter substrate-binding protein [Rhizobium laguerreae]MBY3258631.1 ABC transporter substrate-binding protein [Rhizobium laguerreae]MBY3286468.1 ABC transporter substrate-binding protein [Rhizobium laguerreae]MBY3293131.1 ABC transporter substrate-binding protein [Rhizobium laguerreae]